MSDASSWDSLGSDHNLLERAIAYYHDALLGNAQALSYLSELGLDQEVLKAFRLGFADRSLHTVLSESKQTEAIRRLKSIGLIRRNGSELFADCLVIPLSISQESIRIRNVVGRKVPVIGRKVPVSVPRRKGKSDAVMLRDEVPLLMAPEAHAASEIVLCQSEFDAFQLWSGGIRNVASTLGRETVGEVLLAAAKAEGLRRVVSPHGSFREQVERQGLQFIHVAISEEQSLRSALMGQTAGVGRSDSRPEAAMEPNVATTSKPTASSARNFLFGPVDMKFAEKNLQKFRDDGFCRVFDGSGSCDLPVSATDTWESIEQHFPSGWRPNFLAFYLQYRSIPQALWQAPIPIIGVAGDWNLLWHCYRHALPQCDLVFTDRAGVEAMAREGMTHGRPTSIFGGEPTWMPDAVTEEPRDIDVLFVGNFHSAVQRERLSWIARLASLADRWNIVIRTGVFGEEYHRLASRAKIIFNRSIRGECNNRVFETVAAGALLFQEAENQDLNAFLQPDTEYVPYASNDLEAKLEYFLTHEAGRRAIVDAARKRIPILVFESQWQSILGVVDKEWPLIQQRMQRRGATASGPALAARSWQNLSSSYGEDSQVVADIEEAIRNSPRNSSLHNHLGVLLSRKASKNARSLHGIASAFQNAWTSDPRNAVAGLNLAESLIVLGQNQNALEQLQRLIPILESEPILPAYLNEPHYPAGFDLFRVEWEKAAWRNAGDQAQEAAHKAELIRWRIHTLLGNLTNDVIPFYEACSARPDLPSAQAALGCALGRLQRHVEALPHLRKATQANPFDLESARAYCQSLENAGRIEERDRFQRQRRLLSRAAPGLVPAEPWFVPNVPFRPPLDPTPRPLSIAWQGVQDDNRSLAVVNRELCSRLQDRGHSIVLAPPVYPSGNGPAPASLPDDVDVVVRHQWPPDFSPPTPGHWVMIQPWEFGSLPQAWFGPMSQQLDEIWVPTSFVRDCYVRGGIPEDRVHVVPNGVAPAFLRDDLESWPLQSSKRYKFLFVGGTIERKGIDLLLKAYGQVFSDADDVCLVIKDMGVGTFYVDQTAEKRIAQFRREPSAPEIEYVTQDLTQEEMARLYKACDCLVQPYRGEGFGLPIAEAMACGLPVIVTGYGAALDFCHADNAYLLPARVVRFREKRVDRLETADFPWWAEPNIDFLRLYMKRVFENPAEARSKGAAAREHIQAYFTWDHAIAVLEQRLHEVRKRPVRRGGVPMTGAEPISSPGSSTSLTMIVRNEERNLPECLQSVEGLFGEIVIVDTGSTDATIEVARKFGAKVREFPWIDDFAAARNVALEHATGDWIFWMDADDRLDETNRQKLRGLLSQLGSENVGYVMKCLCLPDADTGTATIVDHVRLFRKVPGIRWQYRVHEQILGAIRRAGGSVRWSDVVIHHVGYQDKAVRQRKLQRDLRLLGLENQERPDDPFTLFNLGSVYQEQGNYAEALSALERSLQLSHPSDSIVRKLYASIIQCHRNLGQREKALSQCEAGRRHYPADAEILFQESLLRREMGDRAGAVACLRKVLTTREDPHFASVDTGLQGHKARHNLAVIFQEEGRLADAETEWQYALAEQPDFLPALLGLADVYLTQNRPTDFEKTLQRLDALPRRRPAANVLRARWHMKHKQFAQAKELLGRVIQEFPQALEPRVILSHALLQEGTDAAAAEAALREVLRLDPNNREAERNLAILLKHGFHNRDAT